MSASLYSTASPYELFPVAMGKGTMDSGFGGIGVTL